MKKIIFMILIMLEISNAKTLTATYDISYGVLKNMGISEAYLNIDKNNKYIIRITGKTTGIAKILSNGRIEKYESTGVFENGVFKPLKYTKIRETNFSKTIKTYTFNHEKKTITKETVSKDDSKKEMNEYYAKDDILSLFFNIKEYMKKNNNNKFYAIGGKKEDGSVLINKIEDNEKIKIMKIMNIEKGDIIRVKIEEDIFSSKKGELYVNLNDENIAEKSILLDVLFFGDIIAKKIN
jgi:predicted DNA-binding antitoxin AbrB/MazE fold protein